jgi:para-nitrobenzyl esterase
MRTALALLQLLLAAAVAAGTPPGIPDYATFQGGAVMGTRQGTVRSFYAVPFAAPTGGANMFAPPQPRDPWAYTMDVSTWGAGCTQPHHNPDVPRNQSQDCLNVNIFAPVLPAGVQVPVMVFFNGGAFLEGSNQGPFGIYSGVNLVQSQGLIVVSANYRLGAFGNLATGREGVAGNFGLMDQVAALQWVQANIAAVGGNASEVTVFGESAGAMSVGLLLATGLGRGLFSRAIMESNVAGFNYKNLSEAAVYGDTFCGLLNCSACALACLRAVPAQAIMDAWNSATSNVGDFILTNLAHVLDGFLDTGPTRDGVYVPSEPMAAVESGEYWGRSVPLLLGTNTNEGETFIYDGVDFPLPNFLAEAAILGIFEDLNVTERVQEQPRYHYQNFNDARTPLSNVVTDYWFRCASEKFLAGAHAAGSAAWAYRFNRAWGGEGEGGEVCP